MCRSFVTIGVPVKPIRLVFKNTSRVRACRLSRSPYWLRWLLVDRNEDVGAVARHPALVQTSLELVDDGVNRRAISSRRSGRMRLIRIESSGATKRWSVSINRP